MRWRGFLRAFWCQPAACMLRSSGFLAKAEARIGADWSRLRSWWDLPQPAANCRACEKAIYLAGPFAHLSGVPQASLRSPLRQPPILLLRPVLCAICPELISCCIPSRTAVVARRISQLEQTVPTEIAETRKISAPGLFRSHRPQPPPHTPQHPVNHHDDVCYSGPPPGCSAGRAHSVD